MIEQMLHTLLGELQKISRAETVVGQPITCGDAVIVPISRVQIGFGAGTTGRLKNESGGQGGEKGFNAAGTGGGIRVEPVACVVMDKTGRAQLLQLTSGASSAVGKAIDLVPEVMDRLGLNLTEPKKGGEGKKSTEK